MQQQTVHNQPAVTRRAEEEKFLQQMLEEEEARDTVFFDENAWEI